MIKPTPKNYKIKTALGQERLTQSLEMFGLASTVVCNLDYSLIDGNSRLEQAKERGEKKIWVSLPSRKLTPKEYIEMSAMYDVAKAGEVDMERIEGDLGTTKEFFEKWNLAVPMHLLEKMGKGADPIINGTSGPTKGKGKKEGPVKVIEESFIVQLHFDEKEEKQFRAMEEKLRVKMKTSSTTDTVFQAFKKLLK